MEHAAGRFLASLQGSRVFDADGLSLKPATQWPITPGTIKWPRFKHGTPLSAVAHRVVCQRVLR